MSTSTTDMSELLREQALRSLKKKHDFHVHLTIYAVVNAFVIALWMMTSGGFFWPIFLIVGWGIGILANAWDTYGNEEPTESQVNREMVRLSRRQ